MFRFININNNNSSPSPSGDRENNISSSSSETEGYEERASLYNNSPIHSDMEIEGNDYYYKDTDLVNTDPVIRDPVNRDPVNADHVNSDHVNSDHVNSNEDVVTTDQGLTLHKSLIDATCNQMSNLFATTDELRCSKNLGSVIAKKVWEENDKKDKNTEVQIESGSNWTEDEQFLMLYSLFTACK